MLDAKLETLLTVAECRNFTRAAEILDITQPAVSHHIGQLEKELGARLFNRGKGSFDLTPEGEIALRYARRLKAMQRKMMQDIADRGRHMTRIRVGITHTSESNTITEILAKYGSLNDNVSITIITDTIKNLYQMLENFEIDIAVVESRHPGTGFNYLMLDTDTLVCVLDTEHRLAQRSMVSVEELKDEHMILRLPSSATRRLFEATLTSIGETIENFNITIEVDNISTIKDLIRKGMGISVLPQSACMDELRKGKLTALPIESLSMTREISLAYNKDFSRVDILHDIVELYRETTGGKAAEATR
ncbi:MAG: LysR family transcriptional regulator [Acutalibacter sp.]|nr:LysR family transcriptional regulator [Acutalibacter sp.]